MKVINWLFGSFFRTIGRTIAILLMGGLLYYILASNGVGISDLFLDRVDALTLDGTFDREVYPFSTEKSLVQLYNTDNKTLNFNTTFNTGDDDYVVIPMTGMVFIQEDTSSSGTSLKLRDVYPYLHVYLITNKNWTACEFQNNFIVCPVKHDSVARAIAFDSFQFSEYTSSDLSVEIQIYYNFNLYKKDSTQMITEQQQTTDAITNQTQQQQQQHQEMMDDNTTAAEDEGSSFFGNFTTEDHGGLNTIITAPLNTIRSLLNSSCTKLTLPLPYVNKNLELPCMNDIYTQHFGLFFSLYQTIILAIISYRCLRSIFFDITGFTNPDDDRIEVMDL